MVLSSVTTSESKPKNFEKHSIFQKKNDRKAKNLNYLSTREIHLFLDLFDRIKSGVAGRDIREHWDIVRWRTAGVEQVVDFVLNRARRRCVPDLHLK